MRKYRQLLLVSIVITSVLALIIYRNEYLKLRSTFEVLDIFSRPEDIRPKDCLTLNDSYLRNYEFQNLFTNPGPIWVNIGEHFVYSAFWQTNEHQPYARAIGVGKVSSKKNYSCHVWYDHQHFLSSSTGKFGYTANLTPNSTFALFEFFCEIDVRESKGRPYMFVFVHKSNRKVKKTFIPIFNPKMDKLDVNKIGFCIRPDILGHSKSEIVEFISFHLVIGLTDLIVYDNGIHHGILTKLKALEGFGSLFHSLSVMNWNFPYEDRALETKVLEMDCLYRTSNQLGALAILEWDQYIVPKKGATISEMVKGHIGKQVLLKMSTQVCCIEENDDKRSEKSWPLILRKSQCHSMNQNYTFILYPDASDRGNKKILPPSTGTINAYRNCEDNVVLETDLSALEFSKKLVTSDFLKLWMSGIFFQ